MLVVQNELSGTKIGYKTEYFKRETYASSYSLKKRFNVVWDTSILYRNKQ